jgi:hypothetical protein
VIAAKIIAPGGLRRAEYEGGDKEDTSSNNMPKNHVFSP